MPAYFGSSHYIQPIQIKAKMQMLATGSGNIGSL